MSSKSNENFFFLTAEQNVNNGTAYSSIKIPIGYELSPDVQKIDTLPFDFNLTLGRLADYLPNNQAWPMCSEKMRGVIERGLTGNENISWIKANVITAGKNVPYYIIRFNQKMDVLDMNKTTFVPGTDQIIRPCFSLDKVQRLALFHKPGFSWRITSAIYVNDKLKKEIEREKLSGVDFEKTMVR